MTATKAEDLGVCRACNAPIRLVFLWEGYPYDTTCDCDSPLYAPSAVDEIAASFINLEERG